MSWRLGIAAGSIAILCAIFWWLAFDRETGSVSDTAHLLTASQAARIESYHDQLLKEFDIDYRVVTVTQSRDMNRFAEAEFDRLDVGRLSIRNRGLLLVVNPETDQVRLEVGYSIEPVFTDAFVSLIERQQMVPFFRAGRITEGILATTELIVQQANQATNTGGWTEHPQPGSGGGGAQTRAHIGAGAQQLIVKRSNSLVVADNTPEATLSAYLAAMAAHQASPDLPIYTDKTQEMLRDWTVTPAQMDNVVEMARSCKKDAVRVDDAEGLAVIRYGVGSRECAPYFLRRSEGKWRLDLAAQQKHIRFSVRNHWRFPKGPPEEFAFAFDDWTFNQFGFPH